MSRISAIVCYFVVVVDEQQAQRFVIYSGLRFKEINLPPRDISIKKWPCLFLLFRTFKFSSSRFLSFLTENTEGAFDTIKLVSTLKISLTYRQLFVFAAVNWSICPSKRECRKTAFALSIASQDKFTQKISRTSISTRRLCFVTRNIWRSLNRCFSQLWKKILITTMIQLASQLLYYK